MRWPLECSIPKVVCPKIGVWKEIDCKGSKCDVHLRKGVIKKMGCGKK